MHPDLPSYDRVVIQYSAGKDSQAMLDYIVEHTDRAGVPRSRLVVFHADLGRVEWQGTPELAAQHAEFYGLRFEMIARPQGDLLDHIEQHGKFPSATTRYCTSDHKRGQGHKLFTRLVRELGLGRQARLLSCFGFRREESAFRRKKNPMRFDRRASNGKRHVDEWLPILDWTEDQVWARIDQAGTAPHWAYAAGMPRLSCSFCVLASRSALIRAAQLRPELAAEYARIEAKIGHRFRLDLSMAEIIAAARTETPTTIACWAA